VTSVQSDEHHYNYHYRLDNAAKIFPGMLSRRRTTIFRLAATIDKPVDVELLQRAYDAMLDRCPYYRVQLRKGLFWYYFAPNATRPLVEAESRYPCLYLPLKKAGVPLFRLIAYKRRIAFEVSHILTDGSGALAFLNGVVAEYLRLRGENVDFSELPIDPGGDPTPAEFADSFHAQYRKDVPPAPKPTRALHFGGKAEKVPTFYVIEGRSSGSQLKERARRFDVTVGEYLTALLIDVGREEMEERGMRPRPIRISIPINLRRFYPSETMRNFVLAVNPGIDPRLGTFEFTDIVAKVHHFMRTELDDRYIRRQIVGNLRSEKNPFIRIVPAVIKDPILRWAYSAFGTDAFTIGFSNLGRVQLPPSMRPFVHSYTFIPPPHNNALNATSIAYGDTTSIVFASTIRDRSFEARFFRRLRAEGVDVSITTNRR
jgi:hypothetical protein